MVLCDVTGAVWRKSSRSGADNNCVEVAGLWRKSPYSANGGNCVELAQLGLEGVGVRDSKRPQQAALLFGPAAWATFASGIKGGRFHSEP